MVVVSELSLDFGGAVCGDKSHRAEMIDKTRWAARAPGGRQCLLKTM